MPRKERIPITEKEREILDGFCNESNRDNAAVIAPMLEFATKIEKKKGWDKDWIVIAAVRRSNVIAPQRKALLFNELVRVMERDFGIPKKTTRDKILRYIDSNPHLAKLFKNPKRTDRTGKPEQRRKRNLDSGERHRHTKKPRKPRSGRYKHPY